MRGLPIVAIDGPSGSGKSTVGRAVATALGFRYVDTGAMYRAVGLRVAAEPVPERGLARAGEIARACRIEVAWDAATATFRIELDGRDVTRDVRSPEAARWASLVAAVPEVRVELVRRQRELGREGGVVMEGRDIGTVVFPDAEFKFFLDAAVLVRGRRRQAEEGREAETVVQEIVERDRKDSTRAIAPLQPAADAVVVDTSALTAEETGRLVLETVRRGCAGGSQRPAPREW